MEGGTNLHKIAKQFCAELALMPAEASAPAKHSRDSIEPKTKLTARLQKLALAERAKCASILTPALPLCRCETSVSICMNRDQPLQKPT